MGIPAAAVLAVADRYNGLGILQLAGRAIPMGNAEANLDRPGWRRAADNYRGGVARTVEARLASTLNRGRSCVMERGTVEPARATGQRAAGSSPRLGAPVSRQPPA